MLDHNIIPILVVIGLCFWLIRSHDRGLKPKDSDQGQRDELARHLDRSGGPHGIL